VFSTTAPEPRYPPIGHPSSVSPPHTMRSSKRTVLGKSGQRQSFLLPARHSSVFPSRNCPGF